MPDKPRKLTAKQELWCLEYLEDLNATAAAKRAGYSEKTARQMGSENLSKPALTAYIQQNMNKRADRTGITQDRVLQEMALIAFGDVRGLFDENGNLRPIHELDEDTARAIAGFEVVAVKDKDGDIEYVKKVKTVDKVRGLDMLAKHLQMFTETHVHSGPGGAPIKFEVSPASKLVDMLAAIAKRGEQSEEPET